MSLFSIDKGNTKQLSFLNTDTLGTLNSGVPTRTTPTLTPTTLRTVEQAIMDNQVEGHHNQARFVPPVIQPSSQGSVKGACYVSLVDSKSWQGGSTRVVEQPNFRLDLSPKLQQPQLPLTPQPRKNVGGRRPIKDKSMSPEEEERRAVRRERNKLAAARCRKRRLDHTNELLMETDGLQEKKQGLQNEIQQLQLQKEELEFILESHKPCCRVKDGPGSPLESKPLSDPLMIENELKKERQNQKLKQSGKRPTTLLVPPQFQPVTTIADGIIISTPSSGINFNFDSLMAGGTGLTPVSAPLIPSCSTQQRNTGCDLSPDSGKLVSL